MEHHAARRAHDPSSPTYTNSTPITATYTISTPTTSRMATTNMGMVSSDATKEDQHSPAPA